MILKIVTADLSYFDAWLRNRELVYQDLDHRFHKREMEMIVVAAHWNCFLAFTESGTSCGMVEISLRNIVDGCTTTPVGYIEGISIEPAFQKRGIARRLMEHAMDWFRENGCLEMATDAELENTKAQLFHRHMGFRETYRTVGFRKKL